MTVENIFCTNCGVEIASGASFCSSCGTEIGSADERVSSSIDAKQGEAALPPLKGANVSNGTVWVLALAPVIGLVLEYFIAGIIYSDSPDPDWMAGTGLSQSDLDVFNAVESGSLFFVTVILNIALSILDERKLRKAGWDTNKIRGMVWLVPVYLFKRAKLLEQNMAYFIVWLVAFGLVFFNMI